MMQGTLAVDCWHTYTHQECDLWTYGHGSRFPKSWPPHLPQILPEVFQSSRIPHPGCPGLISSKSNASLSVDSISTPETRPLGIGIGYLVGNPCPGFSTSLGHCLTFHCQLKNTCRKNIVNLSNHRIIQISPKNTPTATT